MKPRMRKLFSIATFCTLFFLLLPACTPLTLVQPQPATATASPSQEPMNTQINPEQNPVQPGDVQVDETADGSLVQIRAGQMLSVKLGANPTTGFTWEVGQLDPAVLEAVGEPEYKQEEYTGPVRAGVGGWQTFQFKAASAGQTTLQLIYHRPWEKDIEPAQIFQITVQVQ